VVWHQSESEGKVWTYWSREVEDSLVEQKVPYEITKVELAPDVANRAERFEAVKRWFDDDWMRIESKLRTSIVEGISVFLSLFDDHPQVKYTFCPPKRLYDDPPNEHSGKGMPLPPIADLIEQGKSSRSTFQPPPIPAWPAPSARC
jgi:hypothetical protein